MKTADQLNAELAALSQKLREAEERAAKAESKSFGTLRLSVSDKNTTYKGRDGKEHKRSGTLMVLGLGANPLSLYPSQWERLIAFIPTVEKFLKDNPNHPGLSYEKAPAEAKAS